MEYDEAAMKELVCPLCKAKGTLRPIPPRRRFRAGLLSFALLFFKTHQCTACAATFGTEQLIRGQKAA